MTDVGLSNLVSRASAPPRLSWWSAALVLIYAFCALCLGLGTGRVLTQHEVFAAEPAKEMLRALETGRARPWIIPEFAGVERSVKPPTTGWLIAESMALFHSDAEWVARFPAALSGVLTCLVVAWLGGRYFGDPLGLVAGLMQATCFYTLMQARLGEADMILCWSVLCAMTCFIVATIPPPVLCPGLAPDLLKSNDVPPSETSGASPGLKRRRALVYGFYFFSALSLLIKGVGPVFIFPACGLWLLIRRDFKGLMFFASPVGILIFFIIAGSWPLAAYCVDPQIVSVWRRETIGRASGEMGGAEPWWFYVWNVPMLLLPWTPALLAGAIVARRRGLHRTPLGSFALCWFCVGFVLVSCIAWKHKHYIMPALPPLTLVAAGGLLVYQREQFARVNVNYKLLHVTFAVGCVVAIVATLVWMKDAPVVIACLTGALLVGGSIALRAESKRLATLQLAALFSTALFISVGVNLLVLPRFDGYRTSAEFGRRVSGIVPQNQTIYLVHQFEAHVAYYLRPPIARVDYLMPQTVPPEPVFYAVTTRGDVKDLQAFGRVEELDAADELRRKQTDDDRLVLVKVSR